MVTQTRRRREGSLWACIAAAGFIASCAAPAPPQPTLAERMACAPLPGIEAILAETDLRLVVIGGDDEAGAAAFLRAVCLSAAAGETVYAAAASAALTANLHAQIAAWRERGASIETAVLPAPEGAPQATALEADAAQSALADALAGLAGSGGRVIALLDSNSAAKRPVGLTGETVTPAGAQLDEGAVSLLAMRSLDPNAARLALQPFEDIPDLGAARAYDGVIEIAAAQADDALRGR